MKKWASDQKGFTLVELLIVIVVIAILAAISVVAYNGVQDRARYSTEQNDIDAINKAIAYYYTVNNTYPIITGGWCGTTGRTLNIPALVPAYINSIPTMPDDGRGGYYAYICTPNGSDYKILRLATNVANLPSIEASNPNPDPARPGRGWGYWSSGGSGL